ncbi:membrane protein [Scytonema sp. NUACC21]
MPSAIGTGLDSSWFYALSKATERSLIFGKDIIFTYGPFGYLIQGSVTENRFWDILAFRLLLNFTLCAVTVVRILTLKNHVLKLSLGASVLAAYLKVLPLVPEYQILFIFLIILSFDSIWKNKNLTRFWVLGLSISAGFCLLTKFTLGIYTFGSLVLLLAGKIYESVKLKSDIRNSCYLFIEALLAIASTAFILLNSKTYTINFIKSLIFLIVSCFLALSIQLAYGALTRRQTTSIKLSRTLFYLCYSLGLLALVHYSFPSLTAYLKGSWEISSGYSSAMSLVGPEWELQLAFSQIFLILILFFVTAQEGNLSLPLALSLTLFLAFKHGYVRQDEGHIFYFFCVTPLVVALCIIQLKRTFSKVLAVLIHLYTLSVFLLVIDSPPIALSKLEPTHVLNNVTSLLNLNQTREQINASSQRNFSEIKLPEKLLEIVKKKPIDIVPWEISLVEANRLNWQPRPIFQSYSAYTSFLDKQNSQSLLQNLRDYIIYQFVAIDNRHPFFDEPETFFNIFCNYRLSSEIPNFVSTAKIPNFLLLEKRPVSMCASSSAKEKFSLPWDATRSLDVDYGFLVRASIKIEYSLIGKIYKTLFRSPPAMMDVTYANGQMSSYRIIPENAENGVILSHLPIDKNEALSFFQGNLPPYIQSFGFSAQNSILYKPNIEISLTPVKFLDSSIKQTNVGSDIIQVKNLKDIKFLDKDDNDAIGFVDTSNNKPDRPLKKGKKIMLSGWAVRQSRDPDPTWVLITYGSQPKPLGITKTKSPREDIASGFGSQYLNSGWSVTISTQDMPPGDRKLTAWVYDPKGNYARPITGSYRVKIE